MTKEQILQMAQNAGFANFSIPPDVAEVFYRFAKLVRNAALDEAAVKCDELMAPEEFNRTEKTVWDVATLDCGAAIRNLKEPTP